MPSVLLGCPDGQQAKRLAAGDEPVDRGPGKLLEQKRAGRRRRAHSYSPGWGDTPEPSVRVQIAASSLAGAGETSRRNCSMSPRYSTRATSKGRVPPSA